MAQKSSQSNDPSETESPECDLVVQTNRIQGVPVSGGTTTSEPIDAAPLMSFEEADTRLRKLRQSADQLTWKRERVVADLKTTLSQLDQVGHYLEVSGQVTEALDVLSQKLFEEVLDMLKDKLSIAIQEVLEQPVRFNAHASFKRGAAHVDFSVEREGNIEDVNRGQGGSVQNVLSVGLRLFALARLDGNEHRRFLVLDEQDCWLRPELVPRLVNIVHRAAKELNFQVIMISHHDERLFEKYADKIYHFAPHGNEVTVTEVVQKAIESDVE